MDDSADVDINAALEPLEKDDSDNVSLGKQRSWGSFVRASLLSASMLASLAIVAAGVSILGFVFFTRLLAPSMAGLSRDLYFDYSESSAVATTSLLDAVAKGREGSWRTFEPGQQISVWLELEAAEPGGNINTDIFQVMAQLMTDNGKLAATASRPCLIPRRWLLRRWFRQVVLAPLLLLGLWPEHEVVRVPLFSRYTEQATKPVTDFRAILKVLRKDGNLPHLYTAKVHVDLFLGWFGRILYTAPVLVCLRARELCSIKPEWSALPLACLGLAMACSGLALTFLQSVLFVGGGHKTHAPPHSPPHSDIDADSNEEEPPSPEDISGSVSGRLDAKDTDDVPPQPRASKVATPSAPKLNGERRKAGEVDSNSAGSGLHRRSKKLEAG